MILTELAGRPMRLGPCLLFEGHTLQGAHPKLACFCSAPVAGFYAAVDTEFGKRFDVTIVGESGATEVVDLSGSKAALDAVRSCQDQQTGQ